MRFYLCGDGLDQWVSFFVLPSVIPTCKVFLTFSSQEFNVCHNSFNISWHRNLLCCGQWDAAISPACSELHQYINTCSGLRHVEQNLYVPGNLPTQSILAAS